MTMALRRWTPMRDMLAIHRNMDHLMEDFYGKAQEGHSCSSWVPALDLKEEEDRYVIHLDVPGMTSKDLDIFMENNVLSISGERKFENEEKQNDYHRIERCYGKFSRSVTLPRRIQADAITAQCKDGVLEVVVPKSEETKPKKITIKN